MSTLCLGCIPKEHYSAYRYEVIFHAYKWDPQVEDHNTIARHVVLMDADTARQLESWAEKLAAETVQMENALIGRKDLTNKLQLPRAVYQTLDRLKGYRPKNHVRLMRFDFHPTATGWAVSEVNSDVPGGLAEASVLPGIAGKFFPDHRPGEDTARHLLAAFKKRTKPGARIAFVHATSYSDDRQVMQFLGDYFMKNGFQSLYSAPDHLAWEQRRAASLIEDEEGPIDGIVRFFPLEWMANLPKSADWHGYYDTETPSCNHPVAIFAQSKRLPIVWDSLGIAVPTWKELLPETREAAKNLDSTWIHKPALGRVGEGISIREAISADELVRIKKAVRRNPDDWVAQKRFDSIPVTSADGESFHLCVGVFTVDGKAAGFYGRVSSHPRIDAKAKDIPLLIEKENSL